MVRFHLDRVHFGPTLALWFTTMSGLHGMGLDPDFSLAHA